MPGGITAEEELAAADELAEASLAEAAELIEARTSETEALRELSAAAATELTELSIAATTELTELAGAGGMDADIEIDISLLALPTSDSLTALIEDSCEANDAKADETETADTDASEALAADAEDSEASEAEAEETEARDADAALMADSTIGGIELDETALPDRGSPIKDPDEDRLPPRPAPRESMLAAELTELADDRLAEDVMEADSPRSMLSTLAMTESKLLRSGIEYEDERLPWMGAAV